MMETITLGGGCFWCLEAVFTRLRGVQAVQSGYCNGHLPNPSYEQVCSGASGHVEVVQIRFNPEQIALRSLLEVFFAIHDPTTLNRQGADVGTQYRSGIYYQDSGQQALAQQVLAEQAARFEAPLVTEICPLRDYYPAEDYHQRYFERNPEAGYCSFVVAPKVERFGRRFAALLRPDA
ncbi:peptide-methionine (S)-S-oxide reductase [Inhella inkyongensis]|uniref:Peptide methionine sulfoxide reductase MsrA n=1 Tax=Inhella inkyongensis TaxID=392593 RepID=A0A840S6H8_9BURK|nr:peptide-methionine (S)-S-oxide reductase MsrA [Inhella inkyongensis]MBB5204201.1 peptide-methionine (S)-S-oxide reductase [Inhella inkyongensis]